MSKYRLIIVDDEHLIRKGLRECVDWDKLDIEIVGEYANGQEALAGMMADKPDLIISDIEMPVMDGVSFAFTLAKENYDGAIIFYSEHDHFEYARKALTYGVSAYILKTTEYAQLQEKIQNAVIALEKKRRERAALQYLENATAYLKEVFFRKLLYEKFDKIIIERLHFLNLQIPSAGTVLVASVSNQPDETFSGLYTAICEKLKDFDCIGYVWAKQFIILTDFQDVDALKNSIEILLNEQSATSACRVSVGISRPYYTKEEMTDAVKEARYYAERFTFPNINSVKTRGGEGGNKRKKLVDDLLCLISENYMKKLSVAWVAKQLYVSESHLMHEVKVLLNKTFNELLRDYRINKAKELLATKKMRINEVAAAVGFTDARYFMRIFKKSVGCSPTEYMKRQ